MLTPKFDPDLVPLLMKMDYLRETITPPQICHRPHLEDERQTQDDRWGRSQGRVHPHLHPQSTLAAEHQKTARGQPGATGVPPNGGEKLSSIPPPLLYTHTIPPFSFQMPPWPPLLKHRSKSPDRSRRLRNKWRQIPDSCVAFFCSRANIFRYLENVDPDGSNVSESWSSF